VAVVPAWPSTRPCPVESGSRSTLILTTLGGHGAAGLERRADARAGLLSQRQLTDLGVTRTEVRHHLRMRRWLRRTDSVVSTTTGPLSWEQRL
ncbi:MAG: hypothetical protein ABIQ15_14875, partial [Nocardioides sp.]